MPRADAGSKSASKPHPIDVSVGTQLRRRRVALGMSQGELGRAVGLTFQQVQKYERGSNRVSASRLYQLAQVLQISVSFFFEELTSSSMKENEAPSAADRLKVMPSRDMLEMMQDYAAIRDKPVRKAVRELVRLMARSF
jgi:transcriptional regulator with XRE-family HTH domain